MIFYCITAKLHFFRVYSKDGLDFNINLSLCPADKH